MVSNGTQYRTFYEWPIFNYGKLEIINNQLSIPYEV